MSKISKNGLRSKTKLRKALERAAQEEIDDYLLFFGKDPDLMSVDSYDGEWNDDCYNYLDPSWDDSPAGWDNDLDYGYDPNYGYDLYDDGLEDFSDYLDPYSWDYIDQDWHSWNGSKTGAVKSEFTLILGVENFPGSWYEDYEGITYLMVAHDGDLYLADSRTGRLIYWGPATTSSRIGA